MSWCVDHSVFTQVLLNSGVCTLNVCPPMPLRFVLFRSHYFTEPSPICLSETVMCSVNFLPGCMCFCVFVFVPCMSVYLWRSLCFLFPIFWDNKSQMWPWLRPSFCGQSSVYSVALKQQLLGHIIAFIFKKTHVHMNSQQGVVC